MIYLQDADFTLYNCDVLEGLAQLEDESVHCVITSPPYWGLRDYSTTGQLGLEPTPEAYIERMVEVVREVRRVLRKDGTCWLNMGDGYANAPASAVNRNGLTGSLNEGRADFPVRDANVGHRQPMQHGLKPKDLCMIPARLALALQADGWYLRSQIVWAKPNPMPESVSDRPTSAYEFVYLLTRSPRYFYDAEAVREAHTALDKRAANYDGLKGESWHNHENDLGRGQRVKAVTFNPAGRNLRNVWEIPTEPFPEAHFATYPTELVRRCIAAGTSERGCCPECGAPWVRETSIDYENPGNRSNNGRRDGEGYRETGVRVMASGQRLEKRTETTGWRPSCECFGWVYRWTTLDEKDLPVPHSVYVWPNQDEAEVAARLTRPIVGDIFMGSGTTALVARKLGRRCVGIELNPEYCQLAAKRTSQLSLLGEDAQTTEGTAVSS